MNGDSYHHVDDVYHSSYYSEPTIFTVESIDIYSNFRESERGASHTAAITTASSQISCGSACNIIEDTTQHFIILSGQQRPLQEPSGALLPGPTPKPDKIRLDPHPAYLIVLSAPQNPALFSLRIFTPPFFSHDRRKARD